MHAEAKGLAFTSGVNALRSVISKERFAEFTAALPARTKPLIDAPPLANSWMDAGHMGDIYDVGFRVGCAGDLALMIEVGRRSTRANIKGPHKIFVRLLDIGFLLERSARMWETYYRNHGRVEIVDRQRGRVVTRYSDMVLGSEAFWASMQGSLLALAEATRVRDATVRVIEGGGAARECLFLSQWTP